MIWQKRAGVTCITFIWRNVAIKQSRESSIILDISTKRRRWGTRWVRWLFGGLSFSQILLSYLMFVLLGLDRAYLSMDCRNTLPSSSVLLHCIALWSGRAKRHLRCLEFRGQGSCRLYCAALRSRLLPIHLLTNHLCLFPLFLCNSVSCNLLALEYIYPLKGYMKSLWCCIVHRKIFDLLIGWGNIARGTTDTI